jgi:uncharacterized membrane protein YbhN (UPF0104 family)
MIYKKVFIEVVKYAIVIACGWFIYQQFSASGFQLPEIRFQNFMPVVLLVFMMMPVNWYLEAWRWKMAVPFESISIWDACRVVLRGLALNMVVPMTVGDLGSRLVDAKNRPMSLVSLGFSRLTLSLVTVIFGGASVLFYFGLDSMLLNIACLFIVLIVLLLLLTFRKSLFDVSLEFLTSQLAGQIFLLTLIRYAVFTTQFYLLISYFNPYLSFLVVLMGIGWIFLFRSIIPSVLGSIGVREASSIIFFQNYVTDLNLIVFPCLLIWLINTILPAILGLISVINFRFKIA